jgi:hypothetical protein
LINGRLAAGTAFMRASKKPAFGLRFPLIAWAEPPFFGWRAGNARP